MVIIDYYKSLDEGSKIRFREQVFERTGMSYSTFYYKIRNNSFSMLEREAILKLIENAGKN
jgi:hypothetical protein